MKKLDYLPQGAALLGLLLLAYPGHGTRPVPARHTASAPTRRVADEAPTPLVVRPNGTPGWLSLDGVLTTTGPLTADVLAADNTLVTSHTWRGLPAGRVQLALNLRSLSAGAYRLRLSQNGQQWQLPIALK